jgi:hypothetical protein
LRLVAATPIAEGMTGAMIAFVAELSSGVVVR